MGGIHSLDSSSGLPDSSWAPQPESIGASTVGLGASCSSPLGPFSALPWHTHQSDKPDPHLFQSLTIGRGREQTGREDPCQGGEGTGLLPSQKVCPAAHCPTEQRGSPVWSPPAPSKRGMSEGGTCPRPLSCRKRLSPESNLISVPRKMGTEKRKEGEGSRAGGASELTSPFLPGPPHSPGSAAAHSYTSRGSLHSPSARHTAHLALHHVLDLGTADCLLGLRPSQGPLATSCAFHPRHPDGHGRKAVYPA